MTELLDIMAIPLSRELFALVDGNDYEWLNQHKWYALKGRGTYYAARSIGKWPNRKLILMHREILGLKHNDEELTDHQNHCGLDNRQRNLRICTKAENQHNRQNQKGVSKYKGVSWRKSSRKWRAQIKHNYKKIYLGHFDNEADAAKAYDKKAKELFGEFAYTNF